VRDLIARVRAVPIPKEIIVVDDCSTDGTRDILRTLEGEGLRVFYQPVNQGKGAALREGFKHATGDVILIQDADLEYDPADYARLIEPLQRGRATVVYGTRAFASHTAYSFWYVMGNRAVTLTANLLYNVYLSDLETGYKVLPRRVALALDLEARGFELEPEITAKLLRMGHRIYEVPVGYTARSREEGKKLTAMDGVKALLVLARYRAWRPSATPNPDGA